MSFLQWLENAAGNVGRGVGTAVDAVVPGNQSFLHPAPPPPASTARPSAPKPLPTYPSFLTAHPLPSAPIQVPKINMPLEIAKQAVGGIASDLYHGTVDPLLRGGQALTHVTENLQSGQSPLKGVNLPQLAEDTAATGLNFAGPAEFALKEAAPVVGAAGRAVTEIPGAFNSHLDSLAANTAEGGYIRDLGSGQFSKTAVHPDDAQVMANFIDHARGITNLPADQAHQLELDASRVAEHYNIGGKATSNAKLANAFDRVLSSSPQALRPSFSEGGFIGVPGGKPGIVGPELPNIKERGLTTGIKESPNFSPELQSTVKSEYAPATNKAALEGYDKFAAQGLDAAHKEAISVLADPKAQIGKQEVVNYGKTLQALDAAGRTQDANQIHDLLAQRLTEGGQRSQAASLLYQRTPEGLQNMALRDLRTAKVDITPEIKGEIQSHIDNIKSLPEGEERQLAVAKLQKAVANHLPQSTAKNIVSVWKAGLLSGVKTQGGNLLSNSTFAALKSASDVTATAADKAMSLITKERTKTLTGRGVVGGAKEGFRKGAVTMKTGIDMREVGDKYEQHADINFKNPVLQKVLGNPANAVFRGMNAADQPFWYGALKNSMYDQAKADGLTKGLSGKALSEHMDSLVANPTEKMVETATHEANKATLGYDTIAFKGVQAIHQGIDNFSGASEAAKTVAHTIVNVLAPFTKVPTAFLARTVDFTPLGPAKTIMGQIFKKQFDQRSLAQAIGEGVTGTGMIAIGMMLARNNMLSGDYPKNDPKEAARWKAEGITENSVKMGGKWISLNYLGPIGLLFNAGNQMVKAANGGANTAHQAMTALGGLGQGLMSQSFLQGFSGFSDAIQDPARNLQSFVNSEAGSIVPNIINDAANISDSMQRQVNGPAEAIKNRIPGLRETLAPKIDAFGNDLKQAAGGVNAAFNPLKPSNNIDSPMLSELNRLGQTGNLVFPTPSKTIGSGPTATKLNPAQQTQRQKIVGQLLTPLWDGIMKSPQYQAMDDAHKKDALQRALTDVNTAADRQMLAQIDPSKNAKAATASVASVLDGSASPQSYLDKAAAKGTGTSTSDISPSEKYKQALDKFNTEVAAGKLTGPAKLKAQQSLAKQAITSKYPQAVLDFYSLSKADMNAYFKADPATAKQLYDDAKQLDGELVAQTGATSKFKNGLATKSSSSTTKKSKFDYSKLISTDNTNAFKNETALRNLVKAPKITVRKKVSAA